MAIKGAVKAKCPFGCEPFETDVWSLVRGDRDANLKETLLAGELNLLCCPNCGKYFYHEELVVYFDPGMEILGFIFPHSYEAEEKKWRAKMDEDYKMLKERLWKEKQFSFEPEIFFGLEGLKKMLEEEIDREDETKIIECLAEELGLKTRRVKPSYSRARGVPRVIPFSCDVFTKDSAMEGSRKVLGRNKKLASLGKFLKELETGKDCPPPSAEDCPFPIKRRMRDCGLPPILE